MKISVIVSTYNGSEYIIEQLDSLRDQTRKPDEVLISDDVSSDDTVEIVKKYISDNNLQDRWSCSVNAKNKGFIKNFFDGAERSSGDLLLFCDQDDIWEKDKIKELEKVITENNADAAYCLTTTIDSQGNPVKDKLNRFRRVKGKGDIHKLTIEERLNCGRSSGLCLIFKRDMLPQIEEISDVYEIPHDLPVGLIASVKGTYYQLNKPLVRHRVHTDNVSTFGTNLANNSNSIKKQIDSRLFKIRELKALTGEYGDLLSDKQKKQALAAIAIHEDAIRSLNNRKAGKLILSLFKANKMVNKYLTLRNIVAVIRNKKDA